LKEIELIFRKLLVQGHLGNSQNKNQVPYSSIKLPVEKILKICQEKMESRPVYQLRNIRKEEFWKDIVELTKMAYRAIRMSNLRDENSELIEDFPEEEGNMNFPAISASSSERTDDENEEDEID